MNFSWFGVLIFALIAVVVSAGKCPAPFQKDGPSCTAQRTIKGDCPSGSTYKVNINKCVYNH